MHVISRKAIREFVRSHPEALAPLQNWFGVVRHANWRNFSHVRGTFNTVDLYGRCHIFNVGGNRYRIIAAIHYNRDKVFIRQVLTHAEYDRGQWKHECESRTAS